MRSFRLNFSAIPRFFWLFLLSTLLVLGLIGCGGGGSDNPTVTPEGDNTSPTAEDMSISVAPAGSVNGTLSGQDADGDSLTYQIVDECNKGAVTITDASTGAFTYTPNTGAIGEDTFTFQCNDGTDDSNVATVTIAITDASNPTANAGNDASAIAGSTVYLAGSGSGSGDLIMTWSQVISGTEPEVQITDYEDGTASFVAPVVTEDVALTFRLEVMDDQSNTASDDVIITITEATSPIGLSGSLDSAATVRSIDLEAEGTLYWKHWGLGNAGTVTTKSSATDSSLIGDYQPYPDGVNLVADHYDDCPFTFTWPSGAGSPDPAAGDTNDFISFHTYRFSLDQGFQLAVPADTTSRILKLYLGTSSLNANVYAELSDGSAAPYSATIENAINEPNANIVTLTYFAASAGQTLTVRYTYASDSDNEIGGTLNLYAATLQ
jgi:hypothetical protein